MRVWVCACVAECVTDGFATGRTGGTVCVYAFVNTSVCACMYVGMRWCVHVYAYAGMNDCGCMHVRRHVG